LFNQEQNMKRREFPGPDSAFFWYGFWPEDVRFILQTCKDLGTGASISVFEPGWMKNVVADEINSHIQDIF
jgi:hypothetical protein